MVPRIRAHILILTAAALQFSNSECFSIREGRRSSNRGAALGASDVVASPCEGYSPPSIPTHDEHCSPPSITTLDKPRKQPDQKENEYKWLTWFYHQWRNTPAGELDKDVVRLMVPALSLYAKRRTRRSAEQAEEMLNRYIAEYEAGNEAATLTTSIFHGAMDSFAKCGLADEASSILQKMIRLSKSDESLSHLEPDAFSYTILATAIAKGRHPQAADKVEDLLTTMEQRNLTISTITYNVALNAIAVSHDHEKPSRARRLVEKMETLGGQGNDCMPDLYTYQSWMAACSRTRGGLNETLRILNALDEGAASGQEHLRPNTHCFASAIHAWAYSSRPNKAKEAYQLLQEMRRRYEEMGQTACRPNVVVFTSVINACVDTKGAEEAREDAFDIAQLVFDELLSSNYGPPNFLTYAAFLHACATSLKEGDYRDSVVKRSFEMCANYGCVGRIVVEKFREAASQKLQNDILGLRVWEDLPSSWRKNVSGERYQGPSNGFGSRRRKSLQSRSASCGFQAQVQWAVQL